MRGRGEKKKESKGRRNFCTPKKVGKARRREGKRDAMDMAVGGGVGRALLGGQTEQRGYTPTKPRLLFSASSSCCVWNKFSFFSPVSVLDPHFILYRARSPVPPPPLHSATTVFFAYAHNGGPDPTFPPLLYVWRSWHRRPRIRTLPLLRLFRSRGTSHSPPPLKGRELHFLLTRTTTPGSRRRRHTVECSHICTIFAPFRSSAAFLSLFKSFPCFPPSLPFPVGARRQKASWVRSLKQVARKTFAQLFTLGSAAAVTSSPHRESKTANILKAPNHAERGKGKEGC